MYFLQQVRILIQTSDSSFFNSTKVFEEANLASSAYIFNYTLGLHRSI